MMDFRAIYDAYQEELPAIAEVENAENEAKAIYKAVKLLDGDLADRLDIVMGKLARAYEERGFNGGLICARG